MADKPKLFLIGGSMSPPLSTDPRARTCSKCGKLLYPEQVCCISMAGNGKFKEGERVLLSGPHDDIPDEFAVVLEHEGNEMYVVQVEKAVDSSDDRLREISGEFMSRV